MIRKVRMRNFRRFVDAEISLDASKQLVLLAGRNGAGKTTLLEAIRYALYGVGRSPETTLPELIRRGGELEGMQVDVTIHHNGAEYLVQRRLDSGRSSALLFRDGEVIQQGPREVTAAISNLFGMNLRGFDVATFATQKQVNGLSSLDKGSRAKVISRLLQSDAFTKARDDARAKVNDAKKAVLALGEGPDIGGLKVTLEDRERVVAGLRTALDGSRAAEEELRAEVEKSSHILDTHSAEMEKVQRRRDRRADLLERLERVEEELETLPAGGEASPVEVDLEELERAKSAAARQVEDARRVTDRSQQLVDLVQKQEGALRSINPRLRHLEARAEKHARATEQLQGVYERVDELDRVSYDLTLELAEALAEKTRLARSEKSLSALGSTCPECGQEVTEEHRVAELKKVQAQLAEASARADRLTADSRQAEADAKSMRARQSSLSADLDPHAAEALGQAREEKERIGKELGQAREELSSLPQVSLAEAEAAFSTADLALYAGMSAAQKAAREKEAITRRAVALEERNRLQADLEANPELTIEDELAESAEKVLRWKEQVVKEQSTQRDIASSLAVAIAQRGHADELLQAANRAHARRAEYVKQAEDYEKVAALLERTGMTATTKIRPALEGTTSALLATMSEGRFDNVKVSKDYTISVVDDGRTVKLHQVSGGEQDLIALALRLGLAAVVASRTGAGGPGFLVLDEVLASQDRGRRESVMAGLRALRAQYPQILMVSHVDGIDEVVDQVVDIVKVDGDSDIAESVIE